MIRTEAYKDNTDFVNFIPIAIDISMPCKAGF